MKLWFYGVNEILTVQVKDTEGTDDPKTNTMSNNFNVDKEDESLLQKKNESNEKKTETRNEKKQELVYFWTHWPDYVCIP